MTLTRGRIFSFIRGLFEGWFFACLLVATGLNLDFGLIAFIGLLVYLILLLLDQTDNLWEIGGGVIGALLAVRLPPLDGGNSMAYVGALIFLILWRYVSSQQKPVAS